MAAGLRVRVVGGPWPERIGALGFIVEPSAEQARIYPFRGRAKNEVIIRLDSDPIGGELDCHDDVWTCAIDRKDVHVLSAAEIIDASWGCG